MPGPVWKGGSAPSTPLLVMPARRSRSALRAAAGCVLTLAPWLATAAEVAAGATPTPLSLAELGARYPLPVAFGLIAVVATLAAATTLGFSNRRLRDLRQAAEADHQRLNAVIDGTDTGTWEWNVATGETRFNHHWAGMLGYTLADLGPSSIETWRRLTHPDDLALAEQSLHAHFAGQTEVYDATIRMQHRLGHWVWVHDRGRVFSRAADGTPLWMFGTHTDVSRQVHADEVRQAWLQRFEALSANVPGVLYQFRRRADGSSHFPFCGPKIIDIYGCTAEAVMHDSSQVFAVIHADDRPALLASIDRSANRLEPWHAEFRVHHPTKGLRWVAGSATPSPVVDDGSIVWHGYLQDITEARQHHERQRLAAAVFESTREGLLITDALGRIIEINAALLTVTGLARADVLGRRISSLMPDSQFDTLHTAMRQSQRPGGHWRGEIWLRGPQGERLPQLLGLSVVRSDAGQLANYIAVFNDIRDLKAHERELDRIAHYDVLTGIPNRRLLQQRLDQALALSLRNHDTLAICMLDLDGFKPVNDRLGHEAGDQLLQEVARRLTQLLRGDDLVARLGGDEFVLLFRMRGLQSAAVFDRVLATLAEPVHLTTGVVQVTGSLGVAYLDPSAPCAGDQLLRRADQALYRAKAAGRNQYVVFGAPAPAD